jgi:LysR family transcriptional regulator of gallate degradation
MDPRKLLYLAAIIEHGSLAKAAKHLAVSQPALSKSMDRLETELGMKLLDRGPAGIVPTTLGELIYSHARSIRDEMAMAETRIQGAKGHSDVITLGALPSLASNVIARAVARWKEENPTVRLRVIEKVQVELLLGLLRCEFDFIIGETQFFDVFLDGLKQRVLFRDRLCIFARSDHDVFCMEALSWADLAQYPWVCPAVGWSHRTVFKDLVASRGVNPPQQMVECGSIDFTKSLIASSNHLALLPAHAVMDDVSKGTVRAVDFTVPAFKRDIALIFREQSPPDSVSQTLIGHIESVGNELSRANTADGVHSDR